MSQKINRSEIIPEIGTAANRILITKLFSTSTFLESVEKGRPFFTEDELVNIEQKYPDGMTWKEIESEISKKGMILKKPTFRKYVQNKWLPGPIKTPRKEGSELKYPTSIIRGINLIKFLLSEDGKKIKTIISMFGNKQSYGDTLYNILKDNTEHNDPRMAIYYLLIVGDPAIEGAIDELDDELEENIKHKKYLQNKIKKIEDNFSKYIDKEIDEFIDYAENNSIQLNIERLYNEIISIV